MALATRAASPAADGGRSTVTGLSAVGPYRSAASSEACRTDASDGRLEVPAMLTWSLRPALGQASATMNAALASSHTGPWRVTCCAQRRQPAVEEVVSAAWEPVAAIRLPKSEMRTG